LLSASRPSSVLAVAAAGIQLLGRDDSGCCPIRRNPADKRTAAPSLGRRELSVTRTRRLEDGVLRIWRDHPGFEQRFSATLADDVYEGVFQLAEKPGEWMDDMKVVYRRRDQT